MKPAEIQRLICDRWGIRIEQEMARYVLARIGRADDIAVAVMGGDARTGCPIRRILPIEELREFHAIDPSA